MKRLFSLILSATVIAMVIVSCKDDFNEQDFLKLQSELKLKQDSARRARDKAASDSASKEVVQSYITAQNAAGALMAVTIIVREDNTPVQGVNVTISSGSAKDNGRTKATVEGTTDALGTVVFESTVIANSTVTLSRTGYVTASALVDFGSPEAPIAVTVPSQTGGTKTVYISPQKRYENISLPMFSESGTEGNTGVIQGNFSIENDMTNDPAVADVLPPGLTISADLGSALAAAQIINSACGCVRDYRFSGAGGSLGVANIQANGDFSMRVPATAAGLEINLIYPRISGTSRMAIRRLNGQDVAPQFVNVPTVWEPGNGALVTASSNAIPQIPGAMAVFSPVAPPPPGRGFGATFAPIARSLGQGTISANGQTTLNNNTYNFVLRGRGYTASPAVSITGGSGSGATATASLRGYITSAQVTNGGVGYAANTEYDIVFTYTDGTGNPIEINRINVTSTPAGVLPVASLTLPIAFGFPGGSMFATGQAIQGFGVRVSDNNLFNIATASTSNAVIAFTTETELDQVVITDGGSGFLSAPTIAFSGGGASTQASINVVAYRSQYTVSLSTQPATTPYKLLPAQFVLTFPSNAVDGLTIESPATVDRLSSNLSAVAQNVTLLSQLLTDGTNITALNPQHTFRTHRFWTAQPVLVIVDQTIERAVANVTISTAGEVTSIANPSGDVTTINDLFGSAVTTLGNGYDALSVTIAPTITPGAPGTGASFSLDVTQDVATKELTWTGASTQISAGSGYLQNLNRATSNIAYSPEASPVVVTGQTYTINIVAGHGIRVPNVSNN